MVRRGKPGTITAVASVSGLQSAPRHAAYGAAKAGLVNLVKTLAVELAEHGIRVNAVAPGAIATPRVAGGANAEPYAERLRNSMVPFRRPGTPDDIAKAALFFASDLSAYVSGQTLAVDGGWMSAFLIGAPDVFDQSAKVSWARANER
jgi:NAD(P)-dependent dehydrogenase (short-subunit alcohol dehydrogenase family)